MAAPIDLGKTKFVFKLQFVGALWVWRVFFQCHFIFVIIYNLWYGDYLSTCKTNFYLLSHRYWHHFLYHNSYSKPFLVSYLIRIFISSNSTYHVLLCESCVHTLCNSSFPSIFFFGYRCWFLLLSSLYYCCFDFGIILLSVELHPHLALFCASHCSPLL